VAVLLGGQGGGAEDPGGHGGRRSRTRQYCWLDAASAAVSRSTYMQLVEVPRWLEGVTALLQNRALAPGRKGL
jgi:hypothetical protein